MDTIGTIIVLIVAVWLGSMWIDAAKRKQQRRQDDTDYVRQFNEWCDRLGYTDKGE